jgi:hypothetical protein
VIENLALYRAQAIADTRVYHHKSVPHEPDAVAVISRLLVRADTYGECSDDREAGRTILSAGAGAGD